MQKKTLRASRGRGSFSSAALRPKVGFLGTIWMRATRKKKKGAESGPRSRTFAYNLRNCIAVDFAILREEIVRSVCCRSRHRSLSVGTDWNVREASVTEKVKSYPTQSQTRQTSLQGTPTNE